MRSVHLCMRFLILFLLSASATVVSAHAGPPEGTGEVQSADASTASYAHLYILRTTVNPLPGQTTSTVIDSAGGVHVAFTTEDHLRYAYCPSGCDQLANWDETILATLDAYHSLVYPTLAIDSHNRPRLMYYLDAGYYYSECNQDCTNAIRWTKVKAPSAATMIKYPSSSRYFVLDSLDRPHFVTQGSAWVEEIQDVQQGISYATCSENCTVETNWRAAIIGIGQVVTAPQLVVNKSNQPRVMGIVSPDDDRLVFMTCPGDCFYSASWSATELYSVGSSFGDIPFSFRLDSLDRPKVAYYSGDESDPALYYAWGASSGGSASAWQQVALDLPPNDWRTVDLAVTSQNLPRIAFASFDQNLDYAECTSGCETTSSKWQVHSIATAEVLNQLDPIPLGEDCITASWMVDGFPSLVLDAQNRPSVSYSVRHYQQCLDNRGMYATVHDVWGLRFSTAGTSGTTPGNLNHATFIPMLFK